MRITVEDLVSRYKDKLGTKYTFDKDTNPIKNCATLINEITNQDLSADEYHIKTPASEIMTRQICLHHIGWAVWHQGHIGIYIGNHKCITILEDNDYVVKEEDIDDRPWSVVFPVKDVNYNSQCKI